MGMEFSEVRHRLFGVLCVLSLVVSLLPFIVHAERGPRGDVIQRLCQRQEILGRRLPIPFISPEICNPTPAPTLTLSATPSTIMQGASAEITWDSTNATSCVGSGGLSGNLALDGSMTVSPQNDTTYILSCSGVNGTVEKQVTVMVTVPPQPGLTFSATPTTIEEGASSELTWDSTDATTCTGSEGWSGVVPADGTQTVSPTVTTTYVLQCAGAGGTITKSVTVNVTPLPDPTLELSATPTTINEGDSASLVWSTANATTCTASGGWSGSKTLSGNEEVSPVETTIYALSCEGAGGSIVKEVTVTVNEAPAPTLTFSALPLSIVMGASSTLQWDSANADTCSASAGWSGTKTLDGSEVVSPVVTTTYAITCSGTGGDITSSTTVTVQPAVEGALVLSEVLYDPNAGIGSETPYEWVEIYNGTNSNVDLSGYSLSDAAGSDLLPEGLILEAGEYLVVAASSTAVASVTLPEGAVLVVLNSSIGSNGLGNTGDRVVLADAQAQSIDSVSWGTDVSAFDPSVTPVAANSGSSIARTNVSVDTDSASDWSALATPTPGE